MFMNGILIGIITFFPIVFFHPIVIYGEYYFGIKLWPVFLFLRVLLCSVSLFVENSILNTILAITAFNFFWSILELFKQKKRVERGWFPKKQKTENFQIGNINKTCTKSKNRRGISGYYLFSVSFSSNLLTLLHKNREVER
jgi:type II secretory pathway component PulL